MLIDTHAHIQFKSFDDDRKEVIARCREKKTIMNLVSTQTTTSKKAVDLATQHDDMYATIGLHPIHVFPTHVDEEDDSFVSRYEEFDEAYYESLLNEKVIGVGECGIDLFHIPDDMDIDVVIQKQKEIFQAQVRFAIKHNVSLVVHCRDGEIASGKSENHWNAHRYVQDVLKFEIRNLKLEILKGVIHCYTSNWKNAEEYLNMGLFLGFTGVITFPPKKNDPQAQIDLLEVVEKCPLDRIVVETDSPYMAPGPYRGKKSEPWMVEEQIKKIAEIKKMDVAMVEKQIEENTYRLFPRMHKY